MNSKQLGFTLIELILVIVIMGVLATFAAPRFVNQSDFDARGFRDELLSSIRYAQKLAIASQCEVQVVVNTVANTYALYFPNNNDANNAICDGAGAGFGSNPAPHPILEPSAFPISAPSDVTLTNTSGNSTFYFNSQGAPVPGGGSFSIGGHSLTVEPITGYAHL